MEVKHVRDLYEAYRQVHQPQEEVEQLDEFLGPDAAKVVDKATKAVQTGLEKLGVPINRTPRGPVTGPQQKKNIEGNVKEDLFDIIKGHLLDEGYADTEEAATAIMANMSEEWRESIVEKYATFGYNADDPGDDFGQFVDKGPKTNKQKRNAIQLNNKILSKPGMLKGV